MARTMTDVLNELEESREAAEHSEKEFGRFSEKHCRQLEHYEDELKKHAPMLIAAARQLEQLKKM